MVEIKELSYKDVTDDLLDILYDAFKHNKISLTTAKLRFKRRQASNIFIFGIFEEEQLIGTASVLLELKLFRDDKSYVAHIEDVAIHKDYRGFGYGKKLIYHIIEFCKLKDCYKVVLFCSNDNTKFYKKCGFRHTSNLMRKDLD